MGGVEGGKWGGTQTGSGCNFLRKLSEAFLVWPIRLNEGERMRKPDRRDEERDSESKKKFKKHQKKTQTKLYQWNLLYLLSSMLTQKGSYFTQCERNPVTNKWGTQCSWEMSVNKKGWPKTAGFTCTCCKHSECTLNESSDPTEISLCKYDGFEIKAWIGNGEHDCNCVYQPIWIQ